MDFREMTKDCIFCMKCTRNCEFLSKYDICIGDVEKLEELAYHCFLCGECDRVCPKKIKGRDVVLAMREKFVRENKKLGKEYNMLIMEKGDYIFKNYKKANKKSILFPGCNFTSFYPKSMKKLEEIFAKYDIGVAYDCCGKPISELGLYENDARIVDNLNKRFAENGVDEVIMLCPNCYYFLKDRLYVKVVSIYEKIKELGIYKKIDREIEIFVPCPDKDTKELLEELKFFIPNITPINKKQCCGLGGVAIVKEREIAKNMAKDISKNYDSIHTYCATCSGNFVRNGIEKATHILLEIMEDEIGFVEEPATKSSVFNRAKKLL